MKDAACSDRAIAAVWDVMERHRFPHRPDLHSPAPDGPGDTGIWNLGSYLRAVEIADVVLAATAGC